MIVDVTVGCQLYHTGWCLLIHKVGHSISQGREGRCENGCHGLANFLVGRDASKERLDWEHRRMEQCKV